MVSDLGNDAVSDPNTLTGQLRRGRGIGLQRARDTADTGEIIYDCIRDDPRDDHQTETRT